MVRVGVGVSVTGLHHHQTVQVAAELVRPERWDANLVLAGGRGVED